MLKRLLLTLLILLASLSATARDFQYTYEGQTITYTVIDEIAKTCMTKESSLEDSNNIAGDLVLPEHPKDGNIEFTLTEIGADSFNRCRDLTSISIPNSVKKIRDNAFRECWGITSMTVPNSVLSMGNYCFYGCDNLESISLSNSMSTIGTSAFYRCYKLKSVIIPNSVTKIGDYAFSDCDALSTVTFGSSVISIGERAFESCGMLSSVTLPNSIKNIGDGPFAGCERLETISINNGNSNFIVQNNVLYTKDMSRLIQCPAGRSQPTFVIPPSVTNIGAFAFDKCINLTSIVISNAVTSIENSTFAHCENLTSISLPNSITKVDEYAFSYCRSLTSIYLSNSLTKIGKYAFYDCSSLANVIIPQSVTSIGYYAFKGCTGMTKCAYPNTIDNPFSNGTVIAYDPKGAIIEDGWIYGSNKNSILFAPCDIQGELIIPGSVTKIGDKAFCQCKDINSVILPNSVIEIGNRSFASNSNITEIINCTSDECTIGSDVFYDCNKVSTIVVASNKKLLNSFSHLRTEPTVYTFKQQYDDIDKYHRYFNFKLVNMPGIDITATSKIDELSLTVKEDEGVTLNKVSHNDAIITPEAGKHTIKNLYPDSDYCPTFDIKNEFFEHLPLTAIFRTATIFNSISVVNETQSSLTFKVSTINDKRISNTMIYFDDDEFLADKDGCVTIKSLKSNTEYEVKAGAIFNDKTINNNDISAKGMTLKMYPKLSAELTPTTIMVTPSITQGDGVVDFSEFIINGTSYSERAQVFVNLPVNFAVKATYKVNNESESQTFTLPELELTTVAARAASKDCAIICAETNMSEEEYGGGFEWRRYDAPDMVPSTFSPCPVANGHMEGRLRGLSSNTYYKYRPYYEDCNGDRTFGEWTAFITADADVYFEPTVYTYAPNTITQNSATVVGYAIGGSEDVDEQGFEYWATSQSRATTDVRRVLATGQRMTATLDDLEPGTRYTVRAFATTKTKTTYGENQEFETDGLPSAIEPVIVEETEVQPFDIYTLNGVCVRRHTTDLSGLAPGLYIANGKKILVH